MKKLFGIIIAALVLLTACDQGAHGESPPASSTEAATVNAPQTDGEMGSVRYQPTEVAVEDCYGQITDLCAVGQWVYFLAPVKVGETTIADWETGEPVSRIETQPGLFRLDLTTLEVQALPAFSFPAPAEDFDCSAGLQFLQAGADGTLWALRHEFSYSTSQQSYALLQISLEGQVERALPLPYASVEAFVDWEAGRCRFESPAFLALLRLVASLPEEAAQLEEPWLTQEGLLEDSTYFPVLREELEQLFQSSMEVRYSEDADGTLQPEVITSYRPIDAQGRQGETIQVNALTPAQAETVMALIGETRDVARTDPALQEIVLDELDYYLAGAHTAEETAANIQSRATVYVAERST